MMDVIVLEQFVDGASAWAHWIGYQVGSWFMGWFLAAYGAVANV